MVAAEPASFIRFKGVFTDGGVDEDLPRFWLALLMLYFCSYLLTCLGSMQRLPIHLPYCPSTTSQMN